MKKAGLLLMSLALSTALWAEKMCIRDRDRGGEYNQLTVDPAWANLPDDEAVVNNDPAFINEVVRPINAQDVYKRQYLYG